VGRVGHGCHHFEVGVLPGSWLGTGGAVVGAVVAWPGGRADVAETQETRVQHALDDMAGDTAPFPTTRELHALPALRRRAPFAK